VNMRAVDMKRYIVYRGHHPFVPCRDFHHADINIQSPEFVLIVSSRERAKIISPPEEIAMFDKETPIRSPGPPLWVF
jgi:hypothetical protein